MLWQPVNSFQLARFSIDFETGEKIYMSDRFRRWRDGHEANDPLVALAVFGCARMRALSTGSFSIAAEHRNAAVTEWRRFASARAYRNASLGDIPDLQPHAIGRRACGRQSDRGQ